MTEGVHRQVEGNNADITKLAAGASVSLVGKMAGQGLYVLQQIVLARLLGPEAFGLYAIGWTILRIVGVLSPLGLDKGVIRYASRYRYTDICRFKGVLLQSISLAVLSGALVGGGLYLVAPWLAEQVFQKPDLRSVIRWFSPIFISYSGLTVAAAATTVSQRMKYAVYTRDLGQSAVNLLLVVLFYLMGLGLFGAVEASMGSYTVAFILALFYMKHLFPEAFSRQVKLTSVVRELLVFSLPASFAVVFGRLTVWTNRLLVGLFLPTAEVGIYQAASQVPILFPIIASAFTAIASPIVADLHHRKEMGRLDELYKVSTKWGFYLSLPWFLTICSAPRGIMMVVFGTRYESGWLPLVILAVSQLANVGTGAVGSLMIMTGHQSRWFAISGVAFFANIALNWILIPRLGMTGAALGTACVLGGIFCAGLTQVKYLLGVWPYDRRYLKGLLATALAVGAWLLSRAIAVGSPVFSLLLTAAVYCIMFWGVLLLQGLDAEDMEFIRLIQTRLKRPGKAT